jgi:hypothetical protein
MFSSVKIDHDHENGQSRIRSDMGGRSFRSVLSLLGGNGGQGGVGGRVDPVTLGAVLLAIVSGAAGEAGSRLWDKVSTLVRAPFQGS